jgi:hypothetical protein
VTGQKRRIFCENLSEQISGSLSKSSKEQGKREKAGAMTDLLNLILLIVASIGSLAFGILAAYGILRFGFALMRPRQVAAASPRPQVARVM